MTKPSLSLEALCLTLCCLAAAGCGNGGSGKEPNRTGQDRLQPGTDPCANVDPASCDATKGCALVTTCPACPAGMACPMVCQVECRSVPPPPPPSRCDGLDEATCKSTPGCEPLYGGVCPACFGPGCPPCTSGFLGCHDAPVPPPPPPPSKCAGLDEAVCTATPGCQPLYVEACPACAPGATCPPCTKSFAGCVDVLPPPPDRCVGLDERACNMTSGCQGVYRACPPNALCACPAGTDCTKEPSLFSFCQADVAVCGPGPIEPQPALDGGSAPPRP